MQDDVAADFVGSSYPVGLGLMSVMVIPRYLH